MKHAVLHANKQCTPSLLQLPQLGTVNILRGRKGERNLLFLAVKEWEWVTYAGGSLLIPLLRRVTVVPVGPNVWEGFIFPIYVLWNASVWYKIVWVHFSVFASCNRGLKLLPLRNAYWMNDCRWFCFPAKCETMIFDDVSGAQRNLIH